MALVLPGGTKRANPQGSLLPGTITAVNPTTCLVDGATSEISVLTGHPYFPQVGDRVALQRFGSGYLALPVDLATSASYPPDDLWHAQGDPGEPPFINGVGPWRSQSGGGTYGETLRFTRDRAGVVWMEGLQTLFSVSNGQQIIKLPPGYRPAYQLCFTAIASNGVAQIGVDPDGTVYLQYVPASAAYVSLAGVSFLAEDGPNPPQWVDITANLANGWTAANTFVSAYSGATGTPYPGVRYAIDAAGDVHLSGMVGYPTPGQTGTSYLTHLEGTGLAGQVDSDFAERAWLAPCSGAPGFCRQDVFSNDATDGFSIRNVSYGSNTATSGWVSLDGAVWPGGNVTSRWVDASYTNSWSSYNAATWAPLGSRMNKFGTVYLRGLAKGTAALAAASTPAHKSGEYHAPNIQLLFPAMCGGTGTGACRTDVNSLGVVAGVALYGTSPATTGFTSFFGIRYPTKRYAQP